MSMYRALMVQQDASKKFTREQVMLNINNLPENELLIEVKYTALSYIDALMLTGKLEKTMYPMVPGIDATGVVIKSKHTDFRPGDEVIVTGYDMGIKINGGFGAYISVPAEWAVHVPVGYTMKSCITLGTAGIAAGIGAMDLKNTGVMPKKHTIAVTGAACDFGAVATALLSTLGYSVTAYVYSDESRDYVTKLGATKVYPISTFENTSSEILSAPLYDGAFDVIGGNVLTSVMKHMKPDSTVVVAGRYENMMLQSSLAPFLQRAINITGVNSLTCAQQIKTKVWQRLSSDWRIPQIEWLCTEISFDELDSYIIGILKGAIKGRVVINHAL